MSKYSCGVNRTVSIITATYNSEHTILRAINSVNSQEYPHIQHVFIDGGSSDSTLQLIKGNSKRSPIIISEADNGIYDALNKGVKYSTGDIIGFVHSDDVLAADGIVRKIVDRFRIADVDAVYGNLTYVDDSTGRVRRIWKAGRYKYGALRWGWMPPHPTLYVCRKTFFEVGYFDTSFSVSGDYRWIVDLFSDRSRHFEYLPLTLVRMNMGGASNKGIPNILKKMSEDYRVIKQAKIGGVDVLMAKNIRKINQFFQLLISKLKKIV